MRNVQSKYLDGIAINDFLFVGLTHTFQESLSHFFDIMEVEPFEVKNRNVGNKKPGQGYDLEPGVAQKLKELNQEDIKHYDEAVERAIKEGVITDLN